MKNKMKYLFILLTTALIFIGCQDRSELLAPTAPTPVSGNANLTTYVAIGNSLTAGYQSSALYQSAQDYSYPNQIAQQVGATFEQPLIADPGIGGQIKIVSLDPFVTKTEPAQGGAPLNLNYPAPYNNLGIPGVVLADVMNSTATSGSYSNSPFIDIILRGQGTQFAQAKALRPTFITLWIGNNDVLGFATSGGANPSSPTDANTFGFLYGQLADSLAATGAKVVVANIPNVTAIPFFTTVGPGFAQTLTAANVPGFYYEAHGQYSGTAGAPAQLTSNQLLLTLIAQPYLAYFGKPSGKFYRDHNADISLLIAGGIIDTTKPFGADPKNPIPDALILDPSEISTANTATANFNAAIQAAVNKYPNQFALVDINAIFNSIAQNGITVNGINFTTTFVTGGLFSLDGVHPTAQGQAIVANEFLKVINSKFGSNYSLIDVSTIPGSVGLAKSVSINFADKNTFIDPSFKKYLMF
jgi:lysophospholipase L1-like esterase